MQTRFVLKVESLALDSANQQISTINHPLHYSKLSLGRIDIQLSEKTNLVNKNRYEGQFP